MLKEGDVVIVFPLTTKIKTIYGTYIGSFPEKQVQVLLPDGIIFTGNAYEISLVEKESRK